MDKQLKLEALRKEVMEKAAAHLKAVRELPDEGTPDPVLLRLANETKIEWQAAMNKMNELLAEMLKEK